MENKNNTPYDRLSPSLVMDAIESVQGRCTGRLFALNSYENRVYDVEMEAGENVVAKFYRPHRWTDEAIIEEHRFAWQLAEMEVPMVAPLVLHGKTLFTHDDYRFALYPKRGGRAFEVRSDEDFRQIGRLIARMHNVGSHSKFEHRISLTPQTYGWDNAAHLAESEHMPHHLKEAYNGTIAALRTRIDEIWNNRTFTLRLHGDCHLGNILVAADGPFFVDLDDCLSGPAVQDLWMLASGDRLEMSRQFGLLIEGYTQIRDFDFSELQLVEPLRSLRMIHYAAWLAKRWADPTFPKNFPFFQGHGFWEQHILNLKEQIAALDEPLMVSI